MNSSLDRKSSKVIIVESKLDEIKCSISDVIGDNDYSLKTFDMIVYPTQYFHDYSCILLDL